MNPDNERQLRPESPAAAGRLAGIAVRLKPHRAGDRNGRPHRTSPHLLDLKTPAADAQTALIGTKRPPRGLFAIKQKIDEQFRLEDIRTRTLSVRPRGWQDIPHPDAKSARQAIAVAVSKFFTEHPLAELTIITVLHLFVVAVWKAVSWPFRTVFWALAEPEAESPTRTQILPLVPFAAAPATAAETATEAAAPPAKPRARWRAVLAFGGLAVLLILPFGVKGTWDALQADRQTVMNDSLQGVEHLKSAAAAAGTRQFASAAEEFARAAASFGDAKEGLGTLGNLLVNAAAVIPTKSTVSAAGPLLTAGQEIAAGGKFLAQGFAALDAGEDPLAKVNALGTGLDAALPHLERAAAAIGKIDAELVPARYREQVSAAQGQLPRLMADARRAAAAADLLEQALGAAGGKRYLVIFQNNAELRPTGGFIGSFALVDVNRGRLKKVEIPGGGAYDLQGSLSVELASPQPLHLINPRWEFQDVNWFADFPTSAAKLAWFYEKSGGPTTDGVIALTMGFVEKILEVTGPIEMPEYGKTIDARNFYFETQKAVEIEYDQTENRPKQFIADLAPKLLERILSSDRQGLLTLIGTLDDSLAGKDLQFWFRDPELQSQVSDLGWDGALRPADGDYLAVVHTNIAGQKTDLVMREEIDHSVKVLNDGTAIVTLTLRRTHEGAKGALFNGVRNVDFLRVYVPAGSVLVEADGFTPPDPKLFKIAPRPQATDAAVAEQEDGMSIDRATGTRIMTESGKTVFGNWVQTDPGETSVVTLVYKLPTGVITLAENRSTGLDALYGLMAARRASRTLSYSLLIQKQAGAQPARLVSSVDFPRGYRLIWQQPERREDDRGRWAAIGSLDRDQVLGAIAQGN